MKTKTKSKVLVGILIFTTIFGFITFTIGLTRADSAPIYLNPSGDITGETDTQAIQEAFDDAILAGPGSNIILGEGTFYLRHTIHITDFDGTFRGQGKGKTIIVNENCDANPFPADPEPNFFTFTFEERGTDPESPVNIEIADMTIQAIGTTVLWDAYPWFYNMDNSFYSLINIERYFGEYFFDAKYNGIELLGEYYINSWGQSVPNIIEPIAIYAPVHALSGDVSINDCNITNSFHPIAIYFLTNSLIDISYNTFENSLIRGALIVHSKYTNGKISRNTGINSGIIGVYGTPYTYSNTFLIEHNTATNPIDGWAAAIEVWNDNISPERSDFVIVSNKIHNEDSLASGPIWMYGIDNALIANIIITGSGPSAMYIGVDPIGVDPLSSGLMIKGNNLESWKVTDYDGFWGSVQAAAPIWLGSGATNCIVIGNARHNVADDGIDNILLGVDKIQSPVIGQETKEAMELKNNLMKIF